MPPNYISAGSIEPADKHRIKNFPGEPTPTTWGHKVAVTADDNGKVKLFRWPVFGFKQRFRSYHGHGSHVRDARFSYDSDYVISAGGSDMSIFQWRHVIPNQIYVQNLPDAKVGDKYKISNRIMALILTEYFQSMLCVNKIAVNTVMEGKVGEDDRIQLAAEKIKEALGKHGRVSEDMQRHLRRSIALAELARQTDDSLKVKQQRYKACIILLDEHHTLLTLCCVCHV